MGFTSRLLLDHIQHSWLLKPLQCCFSWTFLSESMLSHSCYTDDIHNIYLSLICSNVFFYIKYSGSFNIYFSGKFLDCGRERIFWCKRYKHHTEPGQLHLKIKPRPFLLWGECHRLLELIFTVGMICVGWSTCSFTQIVQFPLLKIIEMVFS